MKAERARTRIAEDLAALGVRRGGLLLVHSSLRSLGRFPGAIRDLSHGRGGDTRVPLRTHAGELGHLHPETVVRGLLDAVGAGGTLLMPALSYATVGGDQRLFDVRRTPSCVGAITEHFRTRDGTIRSVHPTHSVCGVGPLAVEALGSHYLDRTPCGPQSPFRAVRNLGGQILFLGCGMRPNTSMHGVEEIVEPPYLFGGDVAYRVVLADGRETSLTCRRHGFDGWAQRYERIAAFMGEPELRVGGVLEATAHLLDARAFWSCAEQALRRDPLCFVERVGWGTTKYKE